jgi:hypothetical protein
VGESSAIGAALVTGGNGTTITGDFSGEHFSGAGVTIPATVTMTRKEENDGEHNDGDGIGEESSTQRVASCTEDAEGLGYALSTSEKSYKLFDSSSLLLSTIPESDVAPGHATLSPMKRYKRMSVPLEQAGDEGIDSFTPDKQPKQMLVFQRRASPSSKTTKLWVAERVSWNGDRGCNVPTEVLLEKKHKSCLVAEESPENVCSMLGEHEELDMLEGMGNQENESPGVEGSISQHEVEISSEEQPVQGMVLASPATKVFKLAWEVKGTAGMSWDEQDGKLKQVFGHIVADKYGEGVSFSTGVAADGFMGLRDDDISYEA